MQGYQRPNATARCNNLKGSAVNVDLSCSAFDPGDALPDYSGSVPTFSRRLEGQAVGIRVFRGGIGSIGQLTTDSARPFGPGANVFPIRDTVRGQWVWRNDRPGTDVNLPLGRWRSPIGWNSIVQMGTGRPAYHRFQNEFLGTGSLVMSIASDTSLIDKTDASSVDVPLCPLADDSLTFPTKTSGGARIAGLNDVLAATPFELSPNPARDVITLWRRSDPDDILCIVDVFGVTSAKPLRRFLLRSGQQSLDIDLRPYPGGFYWLRITDTKEKSHIIRFIKL